MKKVLLLSPVAGRDEAGGDRTYTHVLEEHPPEGVKYETYDRALERGTLRQRGTGRALKSAVQSARALSLGEAVAHLSGEAAVTLAGKTLHVLRQRKRLFWEPFLFFDVKPGEYDLVHAHIFSARFGNLDCPLVVSCGGRLRHLYLDARGYAPTRVKRLELFDHLAARVLGVNATSEWLPQAAQLYTFTLSGQSEFRVQGILPRERIHYVPFHLPTPAIGTQAPSAKPHRVGFVAREFALKGGPILLRAWEEVRRARPDAQLQIVGSPPPGEAELQKLRAQNVEWSPFVPREQLLNEIMPRFDVFAYPTHYDYLPCYTLLEVMARGVPVAGSDHRDMDVTLGAPTLRDDGRAGLLSPVKDAGALARNILRLLEPDTNRRFRAGARAQFEGNFSKEAVLPRLSAVYERAWNG